MDYDSLLALILLAGAVAAVWTAREATTRSGPPGTAVPPREMKAMRLTFTAAITMARAGRVAEGYSHLLSGRRRALELAQQVEAPWTDSLIRWYQTILEYYVSRYGTE
jgi:hypothetical protein